MKKKFTMEKLKYKVSANLLPPFNSVGVGFILLFFASFFRIGTDGDIVAQQIPFSSQYYTDQFVINPAATGITENINAFLTHRSQWTGLKGAPQTSYFTLDGPAPTKNVGLGLKVYSDVTDMISRAGAFANYSYKLKIKEDHDLYFGLALGILDTKIDFSKAVISDTDDPLLFQTQQNKTIFSADFGVLYMWKKLTVGFAVPQILGNQVKYAFPNGENSYYNLSRHYQGSVKYVFDVKKEKGITAYPLLMIRAVKGAPFQFDINGVVDWKKMGWAALTYHSSYALALSAGVRYHNFSIGYAFDIGVSKIRSYTGSSNEFLLGYIFGESRKGLSRTEERMNDTLNLVKAKKDSTNQALIAQLKATADSNRVEMAKLKRTSTNSDSLSGTGGGNDAMLSQMKTISARYYEVVNQVDDALHAQMKASNDTNQIQINQLKAELAALKAGGAIPTSTGGTTTELSKSESEALRAQFKSKSDSNQVQINQLKARIAAIEASKSIDNLLHTPSNTEVAKTKPPVTTVTSTQGIMRTSESDEYSDEHGKPAKSGYYVVIGTFGNKENVEKFKAANIVKGHVNTKIIQNHFTKVYNVYVLKANNRADADAERAKYKVEYPDVWILQLE